MKVYSETLDPNETKDFDFDWSDKLADGEAIQSIAVSFVDAAGTASPATSNSTTMSKVWLSGGTAGQRCIFTVRVTTDAVRPRVLEESFGVDVVDSLTDPLAETDIERLTREIAAVKAQRANVALGTAVIEVWRDGRRIRTHISSLSELDTLICKLESELATAQIAAGIEVTTTRRRPIGLAWSN